MFLITRFCKPLDLLYCRFKSNQNIFLNKVKYTRILVSETGSLILITLLSAGKYPGLFHCFSFPIEMFGCVIYNFPLMRAPSCLSINIFLPGKRGRTEEEAKKRTNTQNWVHSILDLIIVTLILYCPIRFKLEKINSLIIRVYGSAALFYKFRKVRSPKYVKVKMSTMKLICT